MDFGKISPAQQCHVSGRGWGCIGRLGLAGDSFQHGIPSLGKGSPAPGGPAQTQPSTGEQLTHSGEQMPKWSRSPHPQSGFPLSCIHIPVVQAPPQHLAHASRDAPRLSKALVLLPASCCRPGSLLSSAFSSSSSSHSPGLEGELSWGCLCQKQAQGNGNGWCCSQPGCLPGRLWLYLLSQAPWERTQGLPGAGGDAGAALDPWARSRGVVFLPSSTAALTQEGICNAEKTSHLPRGSVWAGSGAGSSCAPLLGSRLLLLPRSMSWVIPGSDPPFQVGSWRPSGHRAPRTELCPATMQVMLCSPLGWSFCLLPTLDSLSPLSRDRVAGIAGMAGITECLSWSPRHGEHHGCRCRTGSVWSL